MAVTLSAGLVLSATPALADVQSKDDPPSVQDRTDRLVAGVDEAKKVFDGRTAADAGASARDVNDFAVGFVAAGGTVTNVAVAQSEVDRLRGNAAAMRACSGRNSADVTGLQANVYLDSCNASRIVAGLAGGAGVAALVGIITAATGIGGAAGGIAAALLSIGSAAVAYCGSNGRGIGFHVLPVGPPWSRSQ
ncbi:hypothetical protein [Curtobacterium sp. MCBA15_001]|uniref:hypothetical protein n=1 Tax=Curtobacterium sp. MCBA15_001 TaxID=1898731 RepID=UPI0011139205|nr:hypothetical protein [Curtobacterium sp. MCBA15_001]